MPVSWEYTWEGGCRVVVDGEQVCEAKACTKAESRDAAAAQALRTLQTHCYSIKVKSQFTSDGTKVDLMDVEVNTSVGNKASALKVEIILMKILFLTHQGFYRTYILINIISKSWFPLTFISLLFTFTQ